MAWMRVRVFWIAAVCVAGLLVAECCHVPGGGVQYLTEEDELMLQGAHAGARAKREIREVTLDERKACGADVAPEDIPANRVNTTQRVASLRDEMVRKTLDAYIIPSGDEHQSEYVAPADERRRYISGFSGSAGTAVITTTQQALWTDGRYFLQVDDQLDCGWLLMKQKNPGVPTMIEWLKSVLPADAKVGADPRLIGAESWMVYAEELAKSSIIMVAEETNLVDEIWKAPERPPYSDDPITVLELKFAGKPWEQKVTEVREEMRKKGADVLVVTALDEAAWLLNLRGTDIPYNPVFRAYVLVWLDKVDLFLPLNKMTASVDNHLNVNQCQQQECVTINDYATILDTLRALETLNAKKVMLPGKFSYSGGASYAVYSAVPEELRMKETSPVLLMKARKNEVEVTGMKWAHVKDGVALCDFLSFLEDEIVAGRFWSEMTAADRLEDYRAQQDDFMGISFETISGFGSNGAVIHYAPAAETNMRITNESLYLLDSGGQFKDGTTDVTRTLHYGTPTAMQVEAYTRVLMGAIDLATLVFPEGTGDTDVDILARRHLYSVGLDYRHGTGHGIGMFLNVHEAPIQVRIYGREEHAFEVGHFFSDEPGYYLDGEFGIRLENIITVVPKDTKYQFDKQSLGFEAVTLVPFEPRLINISMLNAKQCHWLNAYHAQVREMVGGELMRQNRTRGYEWVVEKTEPVPCVNGYSGPSPVSRRRKETRQQEEVAPEETQEKQESMVVLDSPSLNDRVNCNEGDPQPPIRVNTTKQVAGLREEMATRNFSAYIVPITGEQDGFVLAAEDRLGFLTGFSGSDGVAVVTETEQALWTDGRYYLQAEDELDCNWILMKDGLDGVPKPIDWLKDVLMEGERVAADPKLVDADTWKKYDKELAESGVIFVAEETNLVDLVWPTDERPPYPNDTVYPHEIQFAGKIWEEKVKEVREEMIKQGADLMVVTAADEVAWLLNLRGSDARNTPVFRGYVFIKKDKGVELFIPDGKITASVDLHLNVNQCDDECAEISQYNTVFNRLEALQLDPEVEKVLLPSKWSYSGGASYAIYSAVPEEKRLSAVSPVLLMKARKNPTEIQGMKNSHLRDAIALCTFLAFMETEIAQGKEWDEIEAAKKLYELRQKEQHFTGVSFDTISAFGPNGAVIHYRPEPDTNRIITNQSLYLLDSGGQYKDGTTDVTRTMHYGTPTPQQIEAYTRVLLGAIDLASLMFPKGTGDNDIDILARSPLYEVGLDYRHGTGHGIGHFLGVHEAPTQVRIYSDEEHELEVGQFFSDEPGYYQDNEWGVRLETILTVVPKETKYNFTETTLGFEAVTLVPFEPKLIDLTLFNRAQLEWLNVYHQRVRDEVGKRLLLLRLGDVYDWVMAKTEPLAFPTTTTTTTTTTTRQGDP